MKLSTRVIPLFLKTIFLASPLFCLSACESEVESDDNKLIVSTTANNEMAALQKEPPVITAPEIENKSYLFDITNHSIEELEALLVRAEEVSQAHPADFEDLEIVMIIHGPDIDLFRSQNYTENKQLIDLAARLDTYDVIDMQVCETTMSMRGVDREDIPSFIESVPYAPFEINQRLQDGYINL
ncbi:MAG: hypothetical protein DHS20C09_20160 [marine bacterium B5-7]|nr:MAG: hypothetical protein DHS20C09_20160 [marine bacterium B5-7]